MVATVDRRARLARHAAMSARLASLDDDRLTALLAAAPAGRAGIAGPSTTVTVDGVPVFAKQVPLTDLEREHPGSTANLFDLPTVYQYGLGSAGFGVARELAAHTMTTDWVLKNCFQGVPLLYHWRVLPHEPRPLDPGHLDWLVTRWHGSPAVRARLGAIDAATASVVLFLEHVPYTVADWLAARLEGDGSGRALAFVERALHDGVAVLNRQGLLHFDVHFGNVLTDGRRLYFADFGLAISSRFDLSPTEVDFFHWHAGYDRSSAGTHLAWWLVSKLCDVPWPDAVDHIRAGRHADLPAPVAAVVARHARTAVLMGDFFRDVLADPATAYPAAALDAAFV
jgi:hypothetical protein